MGASKFADLCRRSVEHCPISWTASPWFEPDRPLAIGAGSAAALPSTAVETDLLGQVSADLTGEEPRNRGTGDRQGGRTSLTASQRRLRKEAEAQGLTVERLKQSTSDASRKVQNIVAQSTKRLRSIP